MERPLSPHLQIYKPQITSFMSILHRISGVILSVGIIPLIIWFISAAYFPENFELISAFFTHLIGKIMLFGWSIAFYYHLGNGIRHLFWDIGIGYNIDKVKLSANMVIIFAIITTTITWVII